MQTNMAYNKFNRNNRRRNPQKDPFDMIFRRFKKKAERDGVVKEVRQREFFEKPSSIKNTKNNAQKRKRKLDALKAERLRSQFRRR